MQTNSLLDSFFYASDLIIFMIVFVSYVGIALLIIWIVYTPRLRGYFSNFGNVNGTFYSPAATMFALTAAFMGATLNGSLNAHTEAIKQERAALLLYIDFVNHTPLLANQNLQYRVKAYLQSALDEEWSLLEGEKISSRTKRIFHEIFWKTFEIAPGLEGTQAGRELSKILDSWYEARSERLSFRWHHVEHLRWTLLFVVAFLLQLSVAAAHFSSPKRAMGLAIGIITALIISVITPLALSVDHYKGMLGVSIKPLEEVYERLSEQFNDDR